MRVRARLLAVLALALVACAALAPPAGAQATTLVTARVAPVLGLVIARDGRVGTGSTVDAIVRRQRVGRTVFVTVIPRI